MQKTHAFALLAPVPEMHLLSGLDAIAAQLDADDLPPDHVPKVAFGSMDFEVFGAAEKLRGGQAIEVLIYASQAKGDQPLNPQVTWHGLYVGLLGLVAVAIPVKGFIDRSRLPPIVQTGLCFGRFKGWSR
jgi:hypothetical protein